MGFDINGFKNAFFNAMRGAGNIETQDGQINTASEVNAAKNIQSAFKSELSNMTDPIGDSFIRSGNEAQGEFDNVSIEDLVSLIDDPDLNIARVNQLIEEKPVETVASLSNLDNVNVPDEVTEMAEVSDADTEGVKFHNDMAYATGGDVRIGNSTGSSEEGIDRLGSPKLYDALMYALYAA